VSEREREERETEILRGTGNQTDFYKHSVQRQEREREREGERERTLINQFFLNSSLI